MSLPRLDHLGVVVDDLDVAVAFFLGLGFQSEGRDTVEGEWVDKINGLDGVRAEIEMVRTPDSGMMLEIVKYHAPAGTGGMHAWPANRLGFRHLAIEVQDVQATVDRLRDEGYDTVGEIREFEDSFRLCYIRGPEGLIVELVQRIASEFAG